MYKTISTLLIFIIISHFRCWSASFPEDHVISGSIENWLVERYLQTADEVYTPGIGREGNSILEYKDLGPDDFNFVAEIDPDNTPSWAEQPRPIKIHTPYGSKVLVSEKPSFSSYYTFPITQDTTLIYNLIPQKIYWYRIVDADNVTLNQGVFKTLGYVRAIYSPNVNNIRDIGGWRCNGGRLAYGKIFRGGLLEKSADNPDEQETLKGIVGLKTDIDLRHPGSELGNTSSPLGINYKWYEILAYMYVMTNTWNWNSHAANSGYYKLTGDMIKYVVDYPQKGAFYFHCTAGADRTGTIIALIEALCGVSEEDIVKDWELTTFSKYEKMINRETSSWYHKNAAGDSLRETGDLRSCLKYLYDNFGGKTGASLQTQAENWFKKNVFTTTANQNKYFAGIRNYLIEPEAKSPKLIQEWGTNKDGSCYLLIDEKVEMFNSSDVFLSALTGAEIQSDMFSATDYIDCQGYKCLLSNLKIKNLVSFYDLSHKFISGASAGTNIDEDEVLFDDETSEYTIPEQAAYIRINLPKYCSAYIVLSAQSLR